MPFKKHTSYCLTPSTFWRRAGSLWMCWCGKIFVVRHDMEMKIWHEVVDYTTLVESNDDGVTRH